MGTAEPDPQRQRVYDAEETVLPALGRRFTRWAEVEAWVDDVLADDRFADAFPFAPLEISLGRRSRSATASIASPARSAIWIRDGSWDALTILHELAHLVAPAPPEHGRAFAAAEVELVRIFCGFEAGVALSTAFADHGVDF